MPNKTWKTFEREVAKFFSGTRNPLSGGRSRHTRGDVIHPVLYVECKYSKDFPKKWQTIWEWTEAWAKEEVKVPIVCLKRKNMRGFLAVMRSTDIDKIVREREVIK